MFHYSGGSSNSGIRLFKSIATVIQHYWVSIGCKKISSEQPFEFAGRYHSEIFQFEGRNRTFWRNARLLMCPRKFAFDLISLKSEFVSEYQLLICLLGHKQWFGKLNNCISNFGFEVGIRYVQDTPKNY